MLSLGVAFVLHAGLYDNFDPFTWGGAKRLFLTALILIVAYEFGHRTAKDGH